MFFFSLAYSNLISVKCMYHISKIFAINIVGVNSRTDLLFGKHPWGCMFSTLGTTGLGSLEIVTKAATLQYFTVSCLGLSVFCWSEICRCWTNLALKHSKPDRRSALVTPGSVLKPGEAATASLGFRTKPGANFWVLAETGSLLQGSFWNL